jgi:hypothetical protein
MTIRQLLQFLESLQKTYGEDGSTPVSVFRENSQVPLDIQSFTVRFNEDCTLNSVYLEV